MFIDRITLHTAFVSLFLFFPPINFWGIPSPTNKTCAVITHIRTGIPPRDDKLKVDIPINIIFSGIGINAAGTAYSLKKHNVRI